MSLLLNLWMAIAVLRGGTSHQKMFHKNQTGFIRLQSLMLNPLPGALLALPGHSSTCTAYQSGSGCMSLNRSWHLRGVLGDLRFWMWQPWSHWLPKTFSGHKMLGTKIVSTKHCRHEPGESLIMWFVYSQNWQYIDALPYLLFCPPVDHPQCSDFLLGLVSGTGEFLAQWDVLKFHHKHTGFCCSWQGSPLPIPQPRRQSDLCNLLLVSWNLLVAPDNRYCRSRVDRWIMNNYI